MDETTPLHLELSTQEQALATALRRRDVEALSRLLAADYVFTSGRGETWGRDRAVADLADPQFSVAHIAVDVDRVIALGDVGVVTGRSDVVGRIGEHSLSGAFRFTHVWRRCEGAWQMVAGHTSPAGERGTRESPPGGADQQAAAPGRRG